VLDLIKLKPDIVGRNIKPNIDKLDKILCYNPYGGFRVEFANKYIQKYLSCSRGHTQSLIKRLSWTEVQKEYNNPTALSKIERCGDPILKFYCQKIRQFALDNAYYHQTEYKAFAINNTMRPSSRRQSLFANALDCVQKARNEIMTTSELID
jgi:hypothetical protein